MKILKLPNLGKVNRGILTRVKDEQRIGNHNVETNEFNRLYTGPLTQEHADRVDKFIKTGVW